MNTLFKGIVIGCAIVGVHAIVNKCHQLYCQHVAESAIVAMILEQSGFMQPPSEKEKDN